MSCLSRKETDNFCKTLLNRRAIYWEDLAIELGLQHEELKRIVIKYKHNGKCTEAEKYFVETLSSTVAQIKNGHFSLAVQDPGGSKWALELLDPKYDKKYKDSIRLQAHIVLTTLSRLCNDPLKSNLKPVELYEEFLRELATADTSGATIEAWEALTDSLNKE